MTIEEVKAKKEELECDIQELVMKYEKETQTTVDNMVIIRVDVSTYTQKESMITGILLDVSI